MFLYNHSDSSGDSHVWESSDWVTPHILHFISHPTKESFHGRDGVGWFSYLICQPPWSVHTVVRDKTMLIGHHCPKNCRWLASLVFRELKFLVSPPISWEPEMSAKSFRIHLRSNYNCFEIAPIMNWSSEPFGSLIYKYLFVLCGLFRCELRP